MPTLTQRLAGHFRFEQLGTNWRTETLAGVTTFLTMSYIIFVNPSILADAGMPSTAVAAATCISAAIGCLMMGFYARYPIALAPGMGLNAYFTYTVVISMGVSWQAALGAVFVSGVIFLVLTLAGVQQAIVGAIPRDLYSAVAAGIGFFLAFIGLTNAGLVVANEATLVGFGDFADPRALIALLGLLIMSALLARGVRSAMIVGIIAATLIAAATGLVEWRPGDYGFAGLASTALQLDIGSALSLGLLEIVFVFWFVDFFDNVGTLMAVGKKANLFEGQRIPRLRRILLTDATATIAGSLAGTSTVVSYIESASGVAAGGRSGFSSVVTGLLFLLSLAVAPLVGAIPVSATAPALIVVGSLMMTSVRDIDWEDPLVGIPAFLTIIAIPFGFSIANGLAVGFVAYTALQVLHGEYRRVSWLVYLVTALFLARFIYLGWGA